MSHSKLALLRGSKGWTQAEFAERSKVNRDTISKLETGALTVKDISALTLCKLAAAFDMPVEEFQKRVT